MNEAFKVNIAQLPPREMERLLMNRFRELLLEIFPKSEVQIFSPPSPDLGIDFIARTKAPGGPTLEFLVECKSQPRPSQVPPSPGGPRESDIPAVSINREFNEDHSLRKVRTWVFAVPFVSPRLAEVCWDRGWGWFDLAGNCRISIPGLLYLDRKGNQPVHRSSRPDANLGTPEAAQVLRALLKFEHEAVRWRTQRELQEATSPGVSLGLVNKVVAHLRSEGHLTADGTDGLRIVDPEKLLLAWRDAYRFDRIRRIELFTLLKASEIENAMRELNIGNATRLAWASFSAAERQAPMVRQLKYWLMASDDHVDWVRDVLKAKSVETGSNLTILLAPDCGYLADAKDEDHAGVCTHPLQTYLDTWHAGGRGEEAAQAVLERRLKPSWKNITSP
jgi:Transcriptional regulator, AbiEi antitoxin, Type IV TA system